MTRRNFDSNRLFSLEYEDELIIDQVRGCSDENQQPMASEGKSSASLIHESNGESGGDATMPRHPFLKGKFRLQNASNGGPSRRNGS